MTTETQPDLYPAGPSNVIRPHKFFLRVTMGSGALTYKGKDISIAYTSTGVLTATFAKRYSKIVGFKASMTRASGAPLDVRIADESAIGTDKTVVLNILTPATGAQPAIRKTASVPITDGGVAGTDQAETAFYRTPVVGTVISAHLVTPVAVTADNTDYETITVAKRTAGGGATTVASKATTVAGTGQVAFAPAAMTLGTTALAAGDELTVKAVKGGAGVAIAGATAPAFVHVLIEEVAAVSAVAAALADPTAGDKLYLEFDVTDEPLNDVVGG